MNKNNKLEESLNKIFLTSGYKMIDVSSKEVTHRKALATGEIILGSKIIELIKAKKMPKGDPLSIAEVSGINGVKKTSELIPFCHPLSIESCDFDIKAEKAPNQIHITCKVKISGKTGVEMEAVSGATVAALTIYDMCKAITHKMTIR